MTAANIVSDDAVCIAIFQSASTSADTAATVWGERSGWCETRICADTAAAEGDSAGAVNVTVDVSIALSLGGNTRGNSAIIL